MVLYGFWDASGIGLGTQKPSENQGKNKSKTYCVFKGFWLQFWTFFGGQNWLKNR